MVLRSSEYAVVVDAVDRFALDKGMVARRPIQMDYILLPEGYRA
ncbi:MAG TPA: hypothetical protein VGY31_12580 [Terriglobia bacterium]|nr:hypothetical protein [Terriglobia bacterium]